MGEQASLDFYCDGLVAGCFMDTPIYPTTPGRYRYMPYRSLGHLLFGDKINDAGYALCTWRTADQQVQFVARSNGEYGFLLIDRIGDQP